MKVIKVKLNGKKIDKVSLKDLVNKVQTILSDELIDGVTATVSVEEK